MEQKTEASQTVDERAAFEAWAQTCNGNCSRQDLARKNVDGSYQITSIQNDWEVWQARAALKAQPAPTEAAQVTVTVERGGVYITKGVQSFRLAYEGETQAEKEWYAGQLRAALAQGEDSARLDAQVTAAARVLANRSADQCGVNRDDNWKVYGQDFIDDARAALGAARASAETGGVKP